MSAKMAGGTSHSVEVFMHDFLSQIDDKGRELMSNLRYPIQVCNYEDLIFAITSYLMMRKANDEAFLYLLSTEPIVSYFWEVAENEKIPQGYHSKPVNITDRVMSCLSKAWDKTSDDGEIIKYRKITLTKSCYDLVNAVVTAYDKHGDGKIKEDDVNKIKDWLVHNGPVVKFSLKQ